MHSRKLLLLSRFPNRLLHRHDRDHRPHDRRRGRHDPRHGRHGRRGRHGLRLQLQIFTLFLKQ